MKRSMKWQFPGIGILFAFLMTMIGCSINRNPVAPISTPEVFFLWTFDSGAEGFEGVGYSEAAPGGVSSHNTTAYPGHLYIWVANADPASSGNGWFWGGWYKTVASSGTNLIEDRVGTPYVKVSVRSTNDFAVYLPRKIRIAVTGPDGADAGTDDDVLYSYTTTEIVSWTETKEIICYPEAGDFRNMKSIMISLDNTIHSQGDYFGYIIDEIEVGLK